MRTHHSEQYRKAWLARFPAELWPAQEEETDDGSTFLRLKDGTRLLVYEPFVTAAKAQKIRGDEQNAMIWQPKSQMQKDVLESDSVIVCAGGSAGTYKSETLLVDAVQEYSNPNFHGILFRESFPELSRALIPRAHALYSQMGAIYNSQDHSFHWPWGSVMRFGYLGRDEDVYPHQGPRYTWIRFDESTHMTEFRIRYMLSRLASTDPSMHCRIRLLAFLTFTVQLPVCPSLECHAKPLV